MGITVISFWKVLSYLNTLSHITPYHAFRDTWPWCLHSLAGPTWDRELNHAHWRDHWFFIPVNLFDPLFGYIAQRRGQHEARSMEGRGWDRWDKRERLFSHSHFSKSQRLPLPSQTSPALKAGRELPLAQATIEVEFWQADRSHREEFSSDSPFQCCFLDTHPGSSSSLLGSQASTGLSCG